MNLESPLWRRCYLHLRWYFWRKKPNKSVFRAQFCLLHMLVKHNFFHNTSDNNHLSWATATLARQRIATRRAISSFDTELEESRVLGGDGGMLEGTELGEELLPTEPWRWNSLRYIFYQPECQHHPPALWPLLRNSSKNHEQILIFYEKPWIFMKK